MRLSELAESHKILGITLWVLHKTSKTSSSTNVHFHLFILMYAHI